LRGLAPIDAMTVRLEKDSIMRAHNLALSIAGVALGFAVAPSASAHPSSNLERLSPTPVTMLAWDVVSHGASEPQCGGDDDDKKKSLVPGMQSASEPQCGGDDDDKKKSLVPGMQSASEPQCGGDDDDKKKSLVPGMQSASEPQCGGDDDDKKKS